MEFIEFLSENALAELKLANKELTDMVANVDQVGKKMKNISTPSGSDSAIKSLTDSYNEQAKTIQRLQGQLTALSQAQKQQVIVSTSVGKASSNNTKQTREQAVATQILRAETDRNIRANTLLGGAYAKASAQLLVLKKQAKDYAISLGETHPKTLQAIEDAKNLDSRIKDADKAVGDFQRNVGNYSGGIVGGFKSIYSQARILANILPGIGIAGIFGLALEPLFDYIKGLDIVTGKLHGLAGARKDVNEADIQGQKNAVEETIKLQSLLAIAKDTSLSYKDRMIAVKELQDTYPAYLGNLSKEQILAGDTAKAEKELTQAILSRAKANASIEKITQNQSKIIDLSVEELKVTKDLQSAEKSLAEAQKYTSKGAGQGIAGIMMQQSEAKRRLAQIKSEISDLEKSNTLLSKFALENQKQAIELDYKEEKSKKAKAKAKKESDYIDSSSLKAMENTISKLKQQQQESDITSERYNALGSIISILEETYNGLVESMKPKETLLPMTKGVKDLNDETKILSDSTKKVTDDLEAQRLQELKNAETLAKLKKSTEEYIASFANGFFGKVELGSLQQFFDGTFEKRMESLKQSGASMQEQFSLYFVAISESAQEMFNKITNISNQRFETEKKNLENEKEIALAFAGDNADARIEIERQYQQRQRELKRREFQAKKQQAIFNIVIDTAQGVVSALASTPPNVPLSIAIGAIGLVEAGIVASQQMPEFWKGTDNAPEGWALTQERGREIITDKNGKIKSLGNDKGATPTYLNKGDKVFNNEKTMDYLMFNDGLNAILTSNSIDMPKVNITATNVDLSPVVNAINSKESVNLNIDKSGLDMYVKNGHSTKIIMNNKVRYVGKSV